MIGMMYGKYGEYDTYGATSGGLRKVHELQAHSLAIDTMLVAVSKIHPIFRRLLKPLD